MGTIPKRPVEDLASHRRLGGPSLHGDLCDAIALKIGEVDLRSIHTSAVSITCRATSDVVNGILPGMVVNPKHTIRIEYCQP